MPVWSGLALTTLADVKAYGTRPTSTEKDDSIALMIPAVSAEIEAYLDRVLLIGSTSQAFDVYPDQIIFWLRRYPVSAVTTVQTRGDDDPIDSDDYDLVEGRRIVFTNPRGLEAGDDTLTVTFTGGAAADTAGIKSDYPDIYLAATMQVWNMAQRISEEDAKAIAVGGQNVSTHQVSLLKRVRELLDRHRNDHR